MRSRAANLVLASFLMLFIELALIRWLGANILYLSFYSNFVLLGSFLGIGIGFLHAASPRDLSPWAPVALALLVLGVLGSPITVDRVTMFSTSFQTLGLSAWVVLPAVFLAVTAVMALVAERVARLFSTFEPISAYRLDIVGSLLGIVTFSALSFLWAPPLAWGAVVALGTLILERERLRPVVLVAMAGMLAGLGAETFHPQLSWSPYYQLQLGSTPLPDGNTMFNLAANGIPHQDILSISDLDRYEPLHFHSAVYDHLIRQPGNVLIVGAGNGNDVAMALAHGAQHVDAVEIDPRIQAIGASTHPNHPYDDPRVTVHINDGRAFVEQTDTKYDLIIFALPDSLSVVSGQGSLRLESYLFTRESMESVRAHLNVHGTFSEYNYYRDRWLVDRLGNTLTQTYGHAPCLDASPDNIQLAVLTVSDDPAALRCNSLWATQTSPTPAPVSDDRPFLYLQDPGIPALYAGSLLAILATAFAGVRLGGGKISRMRPYVDLFFMGAAFLLLETKNVVQFALLFGTTWFVNALVFAGILLAVLAAIEFSRLVTIRRVEIVYILLLLALALAWIVPASALLRLDSPFRFACAAALAFAPIFLANLVFVQRFRDVATSTTAFGANLLGAMVGGVLEYASLIFGYRNLLVVVGLLYVLAFTTGRVAQKHPDAAA